MGVDLPHELSDFVTFLLNAFITASVPAIAGAVVFLIRAKYTEIVARAGSGRVDDLIRMTYIVVRAAEQSGLKGLIENTGASKKEYAINALQEWVQSKGWAIPVSALEAHLEQAIFDGFHKADKTAF
jgi:hypothetical protein